MTDRVETGEIMTAIAKAMGQVQRVSKEGRNKHDGYNFASIDDFLALVNPICAENGLVVMMQEKAIEDFTRKGKFGENSWMRVTWEIVVWHISGQSLPPVLRTVEVLRNGAQAYGSSQSYALKQFLRSLFLIPTGDKDDADLQPTDAGVASPVTAPSRDDARLAAPPEAIEAAKQSLLNADTLDRLRDIFTGLPRDVQAHRDVINAKDLRKGELSNPANADLGGDEIPDFDGDKK
jgi:hypothetical protein